MLVNLTSADIQRAAYKQCACSSAFIGTGTLTPTPAARPGPRLRRGRFKARTPMARKQCLLALRGEGREAACAVGAGYGVRSSQLAKSHRATLLLPARSTRSRSGRATGR
ncbi:hypothetical protein XpopCFBP1817_17440 [Xanthomonas populi]|uniref:Uncharacterized protein n=1 Tax=Xanthomonas populi TaxID=53414 RepID=A0A2S7EFK1_9XANT|nr:hypothetical protein XpopCFBP1817_17440 [Xanthomonas populi]